ncbi:MAG: DNA polymerase Y family protein [Aeromicrobium sp.]|uniref:DNA polymerase Y family protein n=1 Tax=Aeromicrobium sp. TaxID=1871063 RepID=UPI0039E6D664
MRRRTLVVWCPDWPVVVAREPAGVPVAVIEVGEIVACSAVARREGVRRGMRRRDAQARCPELRLVTRSPLVESRRFDEVLAVVEQRLPDVAPIRPGLCAARFSGRYYGGEVEAAAVIAEQIVELGVWDVRCGVADGAFAAEQAARQAPTQDVRVVPPGEGAGFLADLGVEVLPDVRLTGLLRRLGLRTLGDFARLGVGEVRTRFGDSGVWAHALARGQDPRPPTRRTPPPELVCERPFEPPLETIEAVAFSSRLTAEQFTHQLSEHGLVATAVRVEVDTGDLVASTRVWRHPAWFDSAALLDRLRWQLAAAGERGESGEPVTAVRFVPEEASDLAEHAETLFGSGPDAQVERSVARVQATAGPEAVRAVRAQGGRGAADRVHSEAWGERIAVARPAERPWPGQIPAPAPATVYPTPRPAAVAGAAGQPVVVSARGMVQSAPARFRVAEEGPWRQVAAWAGPWPVDERWWDETAARKVARFQVVGSDGRAWLLVLDDDRWLAEACYD